VLTDRKDFTLPGLLAAAYDPYLTAFARLVPTLVAAYDAAPADDPLKARLADQIALLRGWDFQWSAKSEATSLAVFWGEAMWTTAAPAAKAKGVNVYDYMADQMSAADKLKALAEASDRLATDFGTWRTPWGQINRFQRLTSDIVQPFDDNGPSIPVPFTSAQWGSLASFGAKRWPGTKKYYGTSGQQLRGRRRVRRQGPRPRRVGRRGERRPGLAALQRPGAAVQPGEPAGRVLLSGGLEGSRRADVPAGRLSDR
jgi:acyl-homoserine-lactone acylase